jgi:hypothetical protein
MPRKRKSLKGRGLPPAQLRLLADLNDEHTLKTLLRSLALIESAQADNPEPDFPEYLREMHMDHAQRLMEAVDAIEEDENRRDAEAQGFG